MIIFGIESTLLGYSFTKKSNTLIKSFKSKFESPIRLINLSFNQDTVYLTLHDKRLFRYFTKTQTTEMVISTPKIVTSVHLNQTYFVILFANGTIVVRDLEKRQKIDRFTVETISPKISILG